MEPLITNPRAQREWDYIVRHVGDAEARAAMARLGNRRPYPLNIARVLGIKLPPDLAQEPPASPDVARAHIAKIREILKLAE